MAVSRPNTLQTSVPREPWRYSLLGLLIYCTALCILFWIGEVIGPFATALLLGMWVIDLGVSMLRIENPITGGFAGLILAVCVVLPLACVIGALLPGENVAAWLLLPALAFYPSIGYAIGTFRAFTNESRGIWGVVGQIRRRPPREMPFDDVSADS